MRPHTLDPTALHFVIREEGADDLDAIDGVTRDAFRTHPFSRQTEHLIVRGLRSAGALGVAAACIGVAFLVHRGWEGPINDRLARGHAARRRVC